MAFDAEPTKLLNEAWANSRVLAQRVRDYSVVASRLLGDAGTVLGRAFGRQPLVVWFSRSLTRLIVLSNLLGLVILLVGYLYMNQYKDWLVDAKVDSLTAQGEIIAQAIAGNATVDGQRIVLDPDALPETSDSQAPFRDDGFAALSFSIGPENITPILRRLLQPDIRARVYDRDGKLLVDSKAFLGKGKALPAGVSEDDSRPKTKNLWTRMKEIVFDSDLPVLKDLEQANGNYYPPVRSAMAGTGTPMLLLNEKSQTIVSYAAPIRRARQINGVLMLSTAPGEIEKVLTKERNAILRLAGLAIAATLAAAFFLAYAVATPIRKLSAAADAVTHNINARHQLPDFSNRRDEVGQLSAAFNAMTAALHRRIEASEKFAADVAHELKNPLTAARSTAESLGYARTDEQRDQLVLQIQLELKRLNKLITDVSNASRLDAELALQEREPIDLSGILEGVAMTFQDLLGSDSSRKVVFKPSPDGVALVVNGNDGRLAQVVTNLLDNAISFSPDGGTITVGGRRELDAIVFTVEDEGHGIAPDKLETVFDRFYTYRPTANASRGNNSGLGLAITREIVKAHDGRIWAENRIAPGAGPGDAPLGARFTVRLPAAVSLASQQQRTAGKLSWRG